MITRIAIEDFKGIGDRIELPIRPITLLFGPNSAGKSSIMHAIHYAREVLERHNLDADRTLTGGDCVNLGGFREMIHRHEPDRRIMLRFDLDLSGVRFHELFPVDEYLVDTEDYSAVGLDVMSGWVEVSVGLFEPTTDASPVVLSYSVGLDGFDLARFACARATSGRDGQGSTSYRDGGVIEWLNLHHPCLAWPAQDAKAANSAGPIDDLYPQCRPYLERLYYSEENSVYLWAMQEDVEWLAQRPNDTSLIVLGFETPAGFDQTSLRCVTREDDGKPYSVWIGKRTDNNRLAIQSVEFPRSQGWVETTAEACYGSLCRDLKEDASHLLAIPMLNDALPLFDRQLRIELPDPADGEIVPADHVGAERFVNQLLARLAVGPGQVLRDLLAQFRYVGPIRQIPPSDHNPPRFTDPSRWASGLAAWDLLADPRRADLVSEVSAWLWDEDRLNTGHQLVGKLVRDVEAAFQEEMLRLEWDEEAPSPKMKEVLAELEKLPVRQRVYLRDVERNVDLPPHSVGVGISQVVPVIAAVLDGGAQVVYIEQPELHLHPALQAKLGELFICRPADQPARAFLIETHSEHLILRLLRRIRETTEGELPPGHVGLKKEQVSVVCIEKEDGGVRAFPLRIDDTGEFIDRWPKGFFEERAEELF